MSEKKCPKCGALASLKDEWGYRFECGSEDVTGGFIQTEDCMKLQIMSLKIQCDALERRVRELEEAGDKLEEIARIEGFVERCDRWIKAKGPQ